MIVQTEAKELYDSKSHAEFQFVTAYPFAYYIITIRAIVNYLFVINQESKRARMLTD